MVERLFSIPVDRVIKARDLLRSMGVTVISYDADPRGDGKLTIDQSKYGRALRVLRASHFRLGEVSSVSRSSTPLRALEPESRDNGPVRNRKVATLLPRPPIDSWGKPAGLPRRS